jgi:hypothetical protein
MLGRTGQFNGVPALVFKNQHEKQVEVWLLNEISGNISGNWTIHCQLSSKNTNWRFKKKKNNGEK